MQWTSLIFAYGFTLALLPNYGQAGERFKPFESCYDPFSNDVEIPYIEDDINNVAVATRLEDGTAIIYYNPEVAADFEEPTQVYWYAHECAHQYIGHTYGYIDNNPEQEADCWAIHRIVGSGQIGDAEYALIKKDISRVPGDGDRYLEGPDRADQLDVCLENPMPEQRG